MLIQLITWGLWYMHQNHKFLLLQIVGDYWSSLLFFIHTVHGAMSMRSVRGCQPMLVVLQLFFIWKIYFCSILYDMYMLGSVLFIVVLLCLRASFIYFGSPRLPPASATAQQRQTSWRGEQRWETVRCVLFFLSSSSTMPPCFPVSPHQPPPTAA